MRSIALNSLLAVVFAGLPTGSSAQVAPKPLSPGALAETSKIIRNGITLPRPGTPPASAPAPQGDVVTALTLDDLKAVMKDAGIGDTAIETRDSGKVISGNSNDVPVEIMPFNCKDDLCGSVALIAYFGQQNDLDPELVTSWNTNHFFHMVQFKTKNLIIVYQMTFAGGVTRDHVKVMGGALVASIKAAATFKPS